MEWAMANPKAKHRPEFQGVQEFVKENLEEDLFSKKELLIY
jgi:hypothetical protein